MLTDLTISLLAALLVGVVPGWFWAAWLLPRKSPLPARLAYSVALSFVLVPAAALVISRLSGGVTLVVALLAPLVVLWSGVAANLLLGPGEEPDEPVADPPPPLKFPALVPLAGALALVFTAWLATYRAEADGIPGLLPEPPGLAITLLLLAAGYAYFLGAILDSRREMLNVSNGTAEKLPEPSPEFFPAADSNLTRLAHRLALPAVLLLVLVRGYLGPILHDWPYVRGVDHYSHAVMADLMLERGEIWPYLIYPPGFHTMTASVSRLTGLDPLEVFAALAPALLALPAVACYVLARALWGHTYGVAAALFSGLLLGSSYQYFRDAMYPNLLAAQFLMVLALAALFGCYKRASWRLGLLAAVVGSGVFLYHQVSGLYLALVAAFMAAVVMSGLLAGYFRGLSGGRPSGRHRELVALGSLGLLGVFSAAATWQTYDLPRLVGGLLGGGGLAGATGEAVGMVVGSQAPRTLERLLWADLTPPVAWLGLLGILLLPGAWWWVRRGWPPALAYLTLMFWALLLFAGSRTPLSGFPERFGRDLGAPLSVLAALALVTILRSLSPHSALNGRLRVAATAVAALAVLLAGTLVGIQAARSFEAASAPSEQLLMTPEIAAAGVWLEANNTGGAIMVSPQGNQVPGRMMLAMGDYEGLQSYAPHQLVSPRDLPPAGAGPLRDVLRVVKNPGARDVPHLLERHDVRYVVLYKDFPDRTVEPYWLAFRDLPGLYPAVFENDSVLIVSTERAREPVDR